MEKNWQVLLVSLFLTLYLLLLHTTYTSGQKNWHFSSLHSNSVLFLCGQKNWQVLLVSLLFTYIYDISGQKNWQILSSGQKIGKYCQVDKKIGKYPLHKIAITAKVHCWPRFARPTINVDLTKNVDLTEKQ